MRGVNAFQASFVAIFSLSKCARIASSAPPQYASAVSLTEGVELLGTVDGTAYKPGGVTETI
jgi:hypothetical protein